jgi:hypothetical protein
MEHPEPGNDWLAKLSESLKEEAPTSEWRSLRQIAKATGLSAGAAKHMANQKVASGEWQMKQFRITSEGQTRLSLQNHYCPASSARSARK